MRTFLMCFTLVVLLMACNSPTSSTPGSTTPPGTVALTLDGSPVGASTTEKVTELVFSFAAEQGGEYLLTIRDKSTTGAGFTTYTTTNLYAPGSSSPVSGMAELTSYSPKPFTAATSGVYFVKVRSTYATTLGSFDVAVRYYAPVALATDGTQTTGSTAAADLDVYSFPVTAGQTYAIRWKDHDYTSRPTWGDVKISGVGPSGETLFTDLNTTDLAPQIVTAGKTGTVLIKVRPYYSTLNFGDYQISATAATQTTDGAFTTATLAADGFHAYVVSTIAGQDYVVSWEDSKLLPQAGGTTSVLVTGFAQGAVLPGFSGLPGTSAGAYSIFTAPASGPLVVWVRGATVTSAGTYRLQIKAMPAPVPFTLGTGMTGTVDAGETRWYYHDAVPEKSYQVMWTATPVSPISNHLVVNAYHADRSTAIALNNTSTFADPIFVSVAAAERIWFRVTGKTDVVTYDLTLTEASLATPTALTVGSWLEGDYQGGGRWLSLAVQAGKSYDVLWQTSGNYDSTMGARPTGRVYLSGYSADRKTYLQMVDPYGSGGTTVAFYRPESSFTTSGMTQMGKHQINPTQDGTVYLFVTAYSVDYYGTYRVMARLHQ